MPITQVLSLQERFQDATKIKVKDITEYGIISPDRRQDAARILLAAKFSSTEVLTYLTDVINTSPLSALEWEMAYLGDSTYRFFYYNIPLYDNAETYTNEEVTGDIITRYADIIYHTASNTYYKATDLSVVGIEPSVTIGWEGSWEVYTIAGIASYFLSDKLTVLVYDGLVTYAYDACLVKQVDAIADKELCGVCVETEAFLVVLRAEFLLNAAESQMWQQKPTRAEVILEEATKKYCRC